MDSLINLQSLVDEAKCFDTVCGGPKACVARYARVTRWPGMVMTIGSPSANVTAARPVRRASMT